MKKIKVVVKKPFRAAVVKKVKPSEKALHKLFGGDYERTSKIMLDGSISALAQKNGKKFAPNIWLVRGKDCLYGTVILYKRGYLGKMDNLSADDIKSVMNYLDSNGVIFEDIFRRFVDFVKNEIGEK